MTGAIPYHTCIYNTPHTLLYISYTMFTTSYYKQPAQTSLGKLGCRRNSNLIYWFFQSG